MAKLKEVSVALLSVTTGVNMQNGAGATTLYTVPTGKVCRVTHVVVGDASATLAGGTDFDFTSWVQSVSLADLTGGTLFRCIDTNNATYTELAAGATFQITPSTGSTGAATATIWVYGTLS